MVELARSIIKRNIYVFAAPGEPGRKSKLPPPHFARPVVACEPSELNRVNRNQSEPKPKRTKTVETEPRLYFISRLYHSCEKERTNIFSLAEPHFSSMHGQIFLLFQCHFTNVEYEVLDATFGICATKLFSLQDSRRGVWSIAAWGRSGAPLPRI